MQMCGMSGSFKVTHVLRTTTKKKSIGTKAYLISVSRVDEYANWTDPDNNRTRATSRRYSRACLSLKLISDSNSQRQILYARMS